MIDYQQLVESVLGGALAEGFVSDMHDCLRMYRQYDGVGQDWEVSRELDYSPTKKRTNIIKKLIKEEARFLFGKPPEITLMSADEQQCAALQTFLNETLDVNDFSEKIVKAARDCFIGKRVALKLGWDEAGGRVSFSFRPATEFVFETEDGDVDSLKSVTFFHSRNGEHEQAHQRIWRQRYSMEDGGCVLWEGVCDGTGIVIEELVASEQTGLSFIPVRVIVNDGLSGDLFGESDVAPLIELQNAYNRLTSDDIDALKFNMFPQTVAVDAMEKSLAEMVIAPGALVDLQTDITAGESRQARLSKLESSFGYDSRLENALNRIKNEMYELLNIPHVTPAELRGFVTSGVAMKALYWQLVTRCEEKFATWRPALRWLGGAILHIGALRGAAPAVPGDMTVSVENVYPLMEEEFQEKELDMALVQAGLMSRRSYLEKWSAPGFADIELERVDYERG